MLRKSFLAVLLAAGSVCLSTPALGQHPPLLEEQIRDVAAQWRALLEGEDREPVSLLQDWGALIMAEQMLEMARLRAAGAEVPADLGERVLDKVLERWRRERPESAGPGLFRAFRIGDPGSKDEAVLALLDRYEDDSLLLSSALEILHRRGDGERALALIASYLERHPDSRRGREWLLGHWLWQHDEKRAEEVLLEWAAALPPSPQLIGAWLGSQLPGKRPQETESLVAAIGGVAAADRLPLCLGLASRQAIFRAAAQSCLAGLAAEKNPAVSEGALTALAELAVRGGDLQQLQQILTALPPAGRSRAFIEAAGALAAPAECATIVDWLGQAIAAGADDLGRQRIAGALAACGRQPAARTLYLELLAGSPAAEIPLLVDSWIRGPFPAEDAAAVLRRRLAAEPRSAHLFRALDTIYQATDSAEKRRTLLETWRQSDPESFFRSASARALAQQLAAAGRPREAAALLEESLTRSFHTKSAEDLWRLRLKAADQQGADALAASLLLAEDEQQRALGHRLAARSALAAGDVANAWQHYRSALEGEYPDREVAAEYLAAVRRSSMSEVADGAVELARELCRDTGLGTAEGGPERCAADLLAAAGDPGAGARMLALRAAATPENLRALEEAAEMAERGERWSEAEQAWLRFRERAPESELAITRLGASYARQGKVSELEDLVRSAASVLDTVPAGLFISQGRALLAAGRPRQAVDSYLEAKRRIEGQGGSAGFFESELRAAYAALATGQPARRPPAPLAAREPAREPAPPAAAPAETPGELLARAEALYGGWQGHLDQAAGRRLVEAAAAQGSAAARLRLALMVGIAGSAEEKSKAAALVGDARAEVRREAEAGSSYAAYLLGTADLVGVGGEVDLASARRWLEVAAAGRQPWALHNLGWMATTGRAFSRAEAENAAGFYRRAAELGNVSSMVDLAVGLLPADASAAGCAEGLGWLERAAKAGHRGAAAFLGKVLAYGRGECRSDKARAVPWLEQAAAEPGARYDLGLTLLAGGDAADRDRALELIRAEAERPDVMAIQTLAWLAATGIATPRDPLEARTRRAAAASLGNDRMALWSAEAARPGPVRELHLQGLAILEKLAAAGDPAAAASLADLYQMGTAVEEDHPKAVALATSAAEAGDPDALRILGHAYRHGLGVPQDAARGIDFYRRGAERGDTFCMMFYSQALIAGELVAPDVDAGLRWLVRAAEGGNWWATADLGRVFAEGRHGQPRNEAEAVRWKRVLARKGDPESRGWLLAHGHSAD